MCRTYMSPIVATSSALDVKPTKKGPEPSSGAPTMQTILKLNLLTRRPPFPEGQTWAAI